jgi:NTE family protein
VVKRYKAAQAAQAKGTSQPAGTDPDARFGAFWGIDTDPAKAAPPGALPCAPATITTLAISPRG